MAPRIFFLFNILIFINLFKYKTIEAHARAFLTLNILAIGLPDYHIRSIRICSLYIFYLIFEDHFVLENSVLTC